MSRWWKAAEVALGVYLGFIAWAIAVVLITLLT